MFVITMTGVAFVLLVALVVPNFVEMFSRSGTVLPLPTRIMIGMSNFMQNYWWFIIIVGIGGAIGSFFYIVTPKDRCNFDMIKLKAPVFGNLFLKSSMSRFARMFETLNKSGLPILQTTDIVSTTIGNKVPSWGLDKVGQGIEKGRGISGPLKKSWLFPPPYHQIRWMKCSKMFQSTMILKLSI